MILVGLTGGIGSGKSSVASRLSWHGAVIIDADAIVRELQRPGQPLLAALAARFGPSILDSSGALDRTALATVAFGDAEMLAALNALVHPAVASEMNSRVDAAFRTDDVVIMDIPLLAESPREGFAAVVVVDCPVEIAVHRLMTFRGFTEADARARIARQATREQRRAIATHVIDNAGSPADLDGQVDALWPRLRGLPATTAADLHRYRSRTASRRAGQAKP